MRWDIECLSHYLLINPPSYSVAYIYNKVERSLCGTGSHWRRSCSLYIRTGSILTHFTLATNLFALAVLCSVVRVHIDLWTE